MIEKDLDKVLNYMKQYAENKYEHDSEPMLTWKDLKLVLNEIDRLNNIINELERILQLEVLKTRENNEYNEYNKGLTNAFNYAIHMISELKGADKE